MSRSSLSMHAYNCIMDDFSVLYYIKFMKFFKLAKFSLFEDFRVLYTT